MEIRQRSTGIRIKELRRRPEQTSINIKTQLLPSMLRTQLKMELHSIVATTSSRCSHCLWQCSALLLHLSWGEDPRELAELLMQVDVVVRSVGIVLIIGVTPNNDVNLDVGRLNECIGSSRAGTVPSQDPFIAPGSL